MSIPIIVILGSVSILLLILAIFLLVMYINHVRSQTFFDTMQELLVSLVILLLLAIYVSLFFIWPDIMTVITIFLVVAALSSV